ncbi:MULTISPECIES: methyltransferase domain-containing protein [Rhodomicrobium]|uniref:class I SAM-dependent methyltransferase n=1 Tax=Rhodomicrobium TaxID=1068 RepID=UPI000B4B0158|nr:MULTISPECIES: methyltransferase domain-containing protein [Rhodomicrobium]
MSFTAHNIRLPDGRETFPEIGYLVADSTWMKAAARVLRVVYGEALPEKSIADLGCLEGGYTAEFSRMGMRAVGIEVRQANFENCQRVRQELGLPNLDFKKDDVWNLAEYGQFDAMFCCGLLYHLDQPAKFIRLMADHARGVVIINTHYAVEKESAVFKLSPLTENEGLPGKWYAEHNAESESEIEAFKWTSWMNKLSFWLTKPAILQTLQDCGFDLVFEQSDWLHDGIRPSMEGGYYSTHHRGMFVGIRSAEIQRAAAGRR